MSNEYRQLNIMFCDEACVLKPSLHMLILDYNTMAIHQTNQFIVASVSQQVETCSYKQATSLASQSQAVGRQ